MGNQQPTREWILGDEKDGIPAMIRWPVTNGHYRFNLFDYDEALELRVYLNTLEQKVRDLTADKMTLRAALSKLLTEVTEPRWDKQPLSPEVWAKAAKAQAALDTTAGGDA